MARFRAVIHGQRGPASRLGSKPSGIHAFVNGWDAGVRIVGFVNESGRDEFHILASGGSNGHRTGKFIAKVTDGVNGLEVTLDQE